MGLEGNLRDLALHEVFQHLAHTRKSGTLHIRAPVAGRLATVTFDGGAIVHAAIHASDDDAQDAPATGTSPTLQQLEDVTLALLTWRDGGFTFSPADPVARAAAQHLPRLNTQAMLVKGARRMEGSVRPVGRTQSAGVVPALADVDARTLPVLHLAPREWELLAYVDGVRDMAALAAASGHGLVDVTEAIAALVASCVLVLLDAPRTVRTHATPPSSAAHAAVRDDGATATVATTAEHHRSGNAALRRGDFAEAIACWERALDGDADSPYLSRTRESIALVTRLGVLLAEDDAS